MWSETYTMETDASAAALFALWRDTTTWPEWNEGVERIELDGPFAAGTTGRMVMPDGVALAFRLAWVEEGVGFEDETPVPDAGVTVRVRHWLQPTATGRTRISYAAQVEGPAADQVGASLGPQVTADFPAVMAAMAARAQTSTPE
jgi:hypothetical protein